jgi:hypothetical protein
VLIADTDGDSAGNVWIALSMLAWSGCSQPDAEAPTPAEVVVEPIVDGVAGPDAWESWVAEGDRRLRYSRFEGYLAGAGVGEVVPAWHLWRQGTDWEKLGEPPFVEPPEEQWAAILPTLVVIREEILPGVGPVEVVSGFRTDAYNARADGAPGSRHKWFEAVDVVPLSGAWERDPLHRALLELWAARGTRLAWGLGLYEHTRFHVDTHRFRRWGRTDVEVPPIVE